MKNYYENRVIAIFAIIFLNMFVVDGNVLKGRLKWENSIGIQYEFGTACVKTSQTSCVNVAYNNTEKALITSILKKIAGYTNNCIRFSPYNVGIARLMFIPDNGCTGSYIGRNEDRYQPQRIYLAKPSCLNEQAISFVLMQTLGFLREQQRPDRDTFVQVNSQYIRSYATEYFKKMDSTQADTLGLPYDYYSITHSATKGFSVNQNATIISKDKLVDNTFIGGKFLTLLDIVKIRKYYGCNTPNNTMKIALKSYVANNKYVFASPKLIVNGNQTNSQTQFYVYFNNDTTVSLKSVSYNTFISVNSTSLTLSALKPSITGNTEKFYMISYLKNLVFFRSKSSTKYISVNNVTNTFVLVANKTVADSNCLFSTEIYY